MQECLQFDIGSYARRLFLIFCCNARIEFEKKKKTSSVCRQKIRRNRKKRKKNSLCIAQSRRLFIRVLHQNNAFYIMHSLASFYVSNKNAWEQQEWTKKKYPSFGIDSFRWNSICEEHIHFGYFFRVCLYLRLSLVFAKRVKSMRSPYLAVVCTQKICAFFLSLLIYAHNAGILCVCKTNEFLPALS